MAAKSCIRHLIRIKELDKTRRFSYGAYEPSISALSLPRPAESTETSQKSRGRVCGSVSDVRQGV